MGKTDSEYGPALIAILRGIEPSEAQPVCISLIEAGLSIFEVTMNSPSPLETISTFAKVCEGRALIGAGTVLEPDQVNQVKEAGGRLIVAPNFNPGVVARAKELDMIVVPGCLTATEIFAALEAGADMVKVFPGDIATPKVIKAYRAVLPKDARLVVTGGVDENSIGEYLSAGAWGLGLGSALYKRGKSADEVGSSARRFLEIYQQVTGG